MPSFYGADQGAIQSEGAVHDEDDYDFAAFTSDEEDEAQVEIVPRQVKLETVLDEADLPSQIATESAVARPPLYSPQPSDIDSTPVAPPQLSRTYQSLTQAELDSFVLDCGPSAPPQSQSQSSNRASTSTQQSPPDLVQDFFSVFESVRQAVHEDVLPLFAQLSRSLNMHNLDHVAAESAERVRQTISAQRQILRQRLQEAEAQGVASVQRVVSEAETMAEKTAREVNSQVARFQSDVVGIVNNMTTHEQSQMSSAKEDASVLFEAPVSPVSPEGVAPIAEAQANSPELQSATVPESVPVEQSVATANTTGTATLSRSDSFSDWATASVTGIKFLGDGKILTIVQPTTGEPFDVPLETLHERAPKILYAVQGDLDQVRYRVANLRLQSFNARFDPTAYGHQPTAFASMRPTFQTPEQAAQTHLFNLSQKASHCFDSAASQGLTEANTLEPNLCAPAPQSFGSGFGNAWSTVSAAACGPEVSPEEVRLAALTRLASKPYRSFMPAQYDPVGQSKSTLGSAADASAKSAAGQNMTTPPSSFSFGEMPHHWVPGPASGLPTPQTASQPTSEFLTFGSNVPVQTTHLGSTMPLLNPPSYNVATTTSNPLAGGAGTTQQPAAAVPASASLGGPTPASVSSVSVRKPKQLIPSVSAAPAKETTSNAAIKSNSFVGFPSNDSSSLAQGKPHAESNTSQGTLFDFSAQSSVGSAKQELFVSSSLFDPNLYATSKPTPFGVSTSPGSQGASSAAPKTSQSNLSSFPEPSAGKPAQQNPFVTSSPSAFSAPISSNQPLQNSFSFARQTPSSPVTNSDAEPAPIATFGFGTNTTQSTFLAPPGSSTSVTPSTAIFQTTFKFGSKEALTSTTQSSISPQTPASFKFAGLASVNNADRTAPAVAKSIMGKPASAVSSANQETGQAAQQAQKAFSFATMVQSPPALLYPPLSIFASPRQKSVRACAVRLINEKVFPIEKSDRALAMAESTDGDYAMVLLNLTH